MVSYYYLYFVCIIQKNIIDVDNNNVDRWIGELKSNAENDVSIILIGNKTDLEDQRQVSLEEAKSKAEHHSLAYVETSALQNMNIEKAFSLMIEG